jgi:hypothetical protein
MAKRTVFYSWQSDLPKGTNYTLIETCLNKAIKELQGAAKLDPALDRDTAGVAGSPDIAATILDKINNCHAFVGDVSIIHGGPPRAVPNPNVLFELGYAVKRLGWDRVICAANEHFGKVESLPFDVRQRRVTKYTLAPDAADRAEVTVALTSALRRKLELILATAQEEGERLQLQFGDTETKTPIGTTLEHSAVYYSYDPARVPDYSYDSDDDPEGARIGHMIVRVGPANRDFHRQLAQYIQHSMAVRKVAFVVYNGNRVPMNDLTMQLVLKKGHGLVVLDDKPYRPAKSATDDMMRNITPLAAHFARPGKLTVNELPDRYEVRVEFGKVQAEANAWSEPVFLGTSESCDLAVSAELSADELTAPRRIALNLAFRMTDTPITELPNGPPPRSFRSWAWPRIGYIGFRPRLYACHSRLVNGYLQGSQATCLETA